jgi:hypothetical protein
MKVSYSMMQNKDPNNVKSEEIIFDGRKLK